MSIVLPNFNRSVVVSRRRSRGGWRSNREGQTARRQQCDRRCALHGSRYARKRSSWRPAPHRHDRSAEMFYVLDGVVQLLSGTDIAKGRPGRRRRGATAPRARVLGRAGIGRGNSNRDCAGRGALPNISGS